MKYRLDYYVAGASEWRPVSTFTVDNPALIQALIVHWNAGLQNPMFQLVELENGPTRQYLKYPR